MKNSQVSRLAGTFRHVVYSPKGQIEGALIDVDGEPVQLVFDHHDESAAASFAALQPGQSVEVEATPRPPSDKGEAEHPVHDFGKLSKVDGKPPKATPDAADEGYAGSVVRFNYARHGEANGVVLDSGHFIHTKPEGLRPLKLKIGDKVTAQGDAHWLATGDGWAVEAHTVNRKAVQRS